MGTVVEFPSYCWKDKIEYPHKEELTQRIINEFEDSNIMNGYFDEFTTTAFMRDFGNPHQSSVDAGDDIIVEDLIKVIENKFKEYLQFYQISTLFFIRRMWYTFYQEGTLTRQHNHTHSTFSGVYYLKFNKQVHTPTLFHNNNFWGDIKEDVIVPVLPEIDEDDIIFYPSRTSHSARSVDTNVYRILIAFDIFCPDISTFEMEKNQLLVDSDKYIDPHNFSSVDPQKITYT